MSSKTNKFADALKKPTAKQQPSGEDTSRHARPSRQGAKHIGAYFDPAVSKQLRMIAVEEDATVQSLLAEALDLLFQSRRKPTIARK